MGWFDRLMFSWASAYAGVTLLDKIMEMKAPNYQIAILSISGASYFIWSVRAWWIK